MPAIFCGAMALRIALGIVNADANDNHVDVVSLIIQNGTLPDKPECVSCYQPKLYYIVCAGVCKVLNITETFARMQAMQLVNVFASFFILLLFWRFIKTLRLSFAATHLMFALAAFNPCLIGINIQGTNDTFAILSGLCITYSAYLFFKQRSVFYALLLAVALIAGALSKASALIFFLALVLAFAAALVADVMAGRKLRYAGMLIVLVAFVAIVPFAGGYYHNYNKYGSFTLSTWEKDTPPKFFEKTWVVRPGLRSMAEGYFTFPFFDMVRQPYVNNEWKDYPKHRTSLWAQLYGRTVFMHYDQWPTSWQTQNAFIVNVGRLLVITGLVPLCIFLVGMLEYLNQLRRSILLRDTAYFSEGRFFFLLITGAMLASSVYYCYNYRDFSAMKSIYIFPGLLAYLALFGAGMADAERSGKRKPLYWALGIMVALSIADAGFLIYQLS